MEGSEEELGELAWSVFRRYRQIQINSFHSILRERLRGSAVVSAGYSHSIAVRTDGTICLWGNMKQGIAPGRYRVQNMSPMPDPNAPLPYSGIQANPMELPTGEVSWFENKGALSEFVAVSAGRSHSLGLRKDGSVACWGNNADGQAPAEGIGKATSLTYKPEQQLPQTFTQVSAGEDHSLALRSDGRIVCWGDVAHLSELFGEAVCRRNSAQVATNANGGDDETTNRYCGTSRFGLKKPLDGEETDCGDRPSSSSDNRMPNTFPNEDIVAAAPTVEEVESLDHSFVRIAAGSRYTLALHRNGRIYCWGKNMYGQAPPEGVGQEGEFVDVCAGDSHALGLRTDGTVACWGHNLQKQAPPEGVGLPGEFVAISAGNYHSLALRFDGTVACWGSNSRGQAPKCVGTPGEFVAIAAGASHSIAVRADGTIACWGENKYRKAPPEGMGLEGEYATTLP